MILCIQKVSFPSLSLIVCTELFLIGIEYTCPNCKKFNPSRKSRQLHPDGPVLPPQTPSPRSSPIVRHATIPNQRLPQHPESHHDQTFEDTGNRAHGIDDDDDELSIAERVRRRRDLSTPVEQHHNDDDEANHDSNSDRSEEAT